MANFLADVGRSNLRAIGSDLNQKAIDLRRRKTQSESDILNMQMDIGKYNTDMAAADRKRQADEFALKKMQDEEDRLNKTADLTVNPIFLSLPEETRGQVQKWGAENGYWNENGVGTVRGQYEALQAVENSQKLSDAFFTPVVEAKKNLVVNAWEDLQKAIQTGDQEKVNKAQQTYQNARVEYEASRDNLSKHLDSMNKSPEILGTTMQPFSADAQVAQELGIKEGDTYYTFADKTGNPLSGADKLTESQHKKLTEKPKADEDKIRKELLDEYQALRSKVISIRSGENIYGLEEAPRNEAIKLAEKRMTEIERRYKDLGYNVADFGDFGDIEKSLNETYPASEYDGKTIMHDASGRKFKSDGKKWVEVY